jgi:hypothetical protein
MAVETLKVEILSGDPCLTCLNDGRMGYKTGKKNQNCEG